MRNTLTGIKYEKVVEEHLKYKNISFSSQVTIGKKRNGRKHRVDLVLNNILVSLKNQNVRGTAEEKIPFEFMQLQHAVNDYKFDSAIIVVSGDNGWTWKDYYLSKEFKTSMNILYPNVSIMSHDQFIKQYI